MDGCMAGWPDGRMAEWAGRYYFFFSRAFQARGSLDPSPICFLFLRASHPVRLVCSNNVLRGSRDTSRPTASVAERQQAAGDGRDEENGMNGRRCEGGKPGSCGTKSWIGMVG